MQQSCTYYKIHKEVHDVVMKLPETDSQKKLKLEVICLTHFLRGDNKKDMPPQALHVDDHKLY